MTVFVKLYLSLSFFNRILKFFTKWFSKAFFYYFTCSECILKYSYYTVQEKYNSNKKINKMKKKWGTSSDVPNLLRFKTYHPVRDRLKKILHFNWTMSSVESFVVAALQ